MQDPAPEAMRGLPEHFLRVGVVDAALFDHGSQLFSYLIPGNVLPERPVITGCTEFDALFASELLDQRAADVARAVLYRAGCDQSTGLFDPDLQLISRKAAEGDLAHQPPADALRIFNKLDWAIGMRKVMGQAQGNAALDCRTPRE